MIRFIAGLDLGQAGDFTALVGGQGDADKRLLPADAGCGPPDKVRAGNAVPDHRGRCLGHAATDRDAPEGTDFPALVIDATGVGRPVVDMFTRTRLAAYVIPMTITAGEQWRREKGMLYVPKKDLAGAVQTGFQTGELKVVQSLPLADTLKGELLNFKVKVTAHANETFGCWRENMHDDLVLAVGMVTWLAYHPAPVAKILY